MKSFSQKHEVALNWLLRLPLLGAYELSMLMDVDEEAARQLLIDLAHAGWLDDASASSPEFEADRLYALSHAGLEEMASALGALPLSTNGGLALRHQEVDDRWSRVETTVGLNRFIAELVLAARSTYNLQVDGLRALPQKRAPRAWWPAGVDAFGFLSAGKLKAPFFIAWDRAAVPRVHRRQRLSLWNTYYREAGPHWGRQPVPVLVLCPNSEASDQWVQAARNAHKRGGEGTVPTAIAEIAAIFSADPLERLWRSAGSSGESRLTERLDWREQLPEACTLPLLTKLPGSPNDEGAKPTARCVVERNSEVRPYSLYRHLGAAEKRVLEWLAFHPLLTVDDLSVLLHGRSHQTHIIVRRLQELRFVDYAQRRAAGDVQDDAYFFLAKAGLRTMAFRDGVPARRYDRFSSVAAASGWDGTGRLQTLLRQFDHTVGTNRLCVRMVADAPHRGCLVVQWLSASEAGQRFSHNETSYWLRPDSILDIHFDGRIQRFFVEWDRATERSRQLEAKFVLYARFLSSLFESGTSPNRLPVLLVVTDSPNRERVIWRILQTTFDKSPLLFAGCFTSSIPLVERLGGLGAVWQCASSGRRHGLLDHDD